MAGLSISVGLPVLFILVFYGQHSAVAAPSPNVNDILDELNLSETDLQYLRSRIKDALSQLAESDEEFDVARQDGGIWDHQSYPSHGGRPAKPDKDDNLLAAIFRQSTGSNSKQPRAYPAFTGYKRAYPTFNRRQTSPIVRQLKDLQEFPKEQEGNQNPAMDSNHIVRSVSDEAKADEGPADDSVLKEVSDHLTAAMIKAKTNGISVKQLMKYFNEKRTKGQETNKPVKRHERTVM